MADCKNCGAPLSTETNICTYCGTRNDIDLQGIHEYTVKKPETDRICPRCDIPLQTINLKIEGDFLIERCKDCMGMFFDPGELEFLLEKSVSNVFEVDYKKLNVINKEMRRSDYPTMYIKCPVCSEMMNRINFGLKSGVIVDRCKAHGIWLDSAELRHLLEWKKSGGAILDKERKEEIQKREEKRREKAAVKRMSMPDSMERSYGSGGFGFGASDYHDDDIMDIIYKAVTRLFR